MTIQQELTQARSQIDDVRSVNRNLEMIKVTDYLPDCTCLQRLSAHLMQLADVSDGPES